MAKKRGISLRISCQRVEALEEICEEMLDEFNPATEHQLLLREYLYELKQKLNAMRLRNQELYTLNMTGSESIAFCQLWNLLDIRRDRYANLIVDNLLKKISPIAA